MFEQRVLCVSANGLKGVRGEGRIGEDHGYAHFLQLAGPSIQCQLREPEETRDTYSARFLWFLLSGAPLPSPMTPGVGRTLSGLDVRPSSSFAEDWTTAGGISLSSASIAARTSPSPPATCSLAFRLRRRSWDLEYGE